MRKAAKVWLRIAAALVVVGCVLFAAVMSALRWDFTKLSTVRYETRIYEIDEAFSDISLTSDTADIVLARSADGTCSVECEEEENAKHTVVVENGALTVRINDQRSWQDRIRFSFGSPRITVYLPAADYAELSVRGSTGDVTVSKELSFTNIDISVSTGSVTVSGANCKGNITVGTVTGGVCLSDISCRSLLSGGTTGNITLDRVIASERISIERSTGNVGLKDSDAAEIFVRTGTGNVSGSLLSDKVFLVQTGTGNVDVPQTTTGGRCEIETGTGDIEMEICGK